MNLRARAPEAPGEVHLAKALGLAASELASHLEPNLALDARHSGGLLMVMQNPHLVAPCQPAVKGTWRTL
jgi:hypothetical protein